VQIGLAHADWLGTTRLNSNLSRGVTFDAAAAPFGEAYATTSPSLGVFAGIGDYLEGDLYDATFREYHAGQGRWITNAACQQIRGH
jgi:hypothetical protein